MAESSLIERSRSNSPQPAAAMEVEDEINDVAVNSTVAQEPDYGTNPTPVASFSAPTEGITGSSSSATIPVINDETAPADTEARIPTKKDITLREFLGKMEDHAPIVPDAVTNYYLTLAGLPPPPETPPHLARLLALATQKFVADIAADAYQYARIRSSHTTSNTAAAIAAMPGSGAAAVLGVAAGGAGGVGGGIGKDGDKPGGIGAKQGMNLGVQRPGFGGSSQGISHGRTVLTMEDLGMAVGEYGVNVKRGEFYR